MKHYVISDKISNTALTSNGFSGTHEYFFKKVPIHKTIEMEIYVDASDNYFEYRIKDCNTGFPYAAYYIDFGNNEVVEKCKQIVSAEIDKLIKSNIIKEDI